MKQAVLYLITSPSGKRYVGVTTNLSHRLWKHEHARSIIGNSLRKYGRSAHTIEVLIETDEDAAYELEKWAIAWYGSLAPAGLNVQIGGFAGMHGFHHSETTCQKISQIKRDYYAARGGVRTEAEKAAIRAGCNGKKRKPFTSDRRKAASEAAKARWARQNALSVAA